MQTPQTPTPLNLLLLQTADMLWTFSAPPQSKDHRPSPTGELQTLSLTMPFFARSNEALVCPRIFVGMESYSPADFLRSALGLGQERAQALSDWILADLHDWDLNFNRTSMRRGMLNKTRAIVEATTLLAHQNLGLANENGHPSVKPQKDFYAFVSNARYKDELGQALEGIELPERLHERILPLVEASALRVVVQEAKGEKPRSEEPNAFAGPHEGDEAFTRAAKRL
jgi:hypothetical protein